MVRVNLQTSQLELLALTQPLSLPHAAKWVPGYHCINNLLLTAALVLSAHPILV